MMHDGQDTERLGQLLSRNVGGRCEAPCVDGTIPHMAMSQPVLLLPLPVAP